VTDQPSKGVIESRRRRRNDDSDQCDIIYQVSGDFTFIPPGNQSLPE
jgi:hypothetical protein